MFCFQAVMSVLAEHKHTFADHACLRLLRAKITVNLLDKLPRVVREQVWREGCGVVRRAVWSAVRDYHQPHSWVPFMYVFYSPCLLYTSPSPRDGLLSRMPSSA